MSRQMLLWAVKVPAAALVVITLWRVHGGHYPLWVDLMVYATSALMTFAAVDMATSSSHRESPDPARHFRSQMKTCADMAISAARRKAAPDQRGTVTVADVLACASEHFGLIAVPPEQAASALRARYELRSGSFDLNTDAYDAELS